MMNNLPALATVETFRNQVICCDAMTLLRSLPSESVHCIVTSPPYYGLRDYGTAQWEGGDPDCEHTTGNQVQDSKAPGAIVSGVRPGSDNSHCRKCGAVRVDNQIGLEDTPQAYVQRLVELFREARRVLRDDGTLWLNLGDSYANDTKWGGSSGGKNYTSKEGGYAGQREKRSTGLKPKDLIGIPWRVAFALQDDGWYLRSDIIWAKPNAMPESVTDRPTKAHEYVFLFSKSGETTYWTHREHDGVRSQPLPDHRWIDNLTGVEAVTPPDNWQTEKLPDGKKRWRRINLWSGHDYYYDSDAIKEPAVNGDPASPRGSKGVIDNPLNSGARADKQSQVGNRRYTGFNERWDARKEPLTMRNRRTVWTVPTKPMSLAHFATFPPALIEPMILAGCPGKVCSVCGAPYERVTEVIGMRQVQNGPGTVKKRELAAGKHGSTSALVTGFQQVRETTGFNATCSCGAGTSHGIVLDMFMGSGTVALESRRLGRDFLGCDLNPEYVASISKVRLDEPYMVDMFAYLSQER